MKLGISSLALLILASSITQATEVLKPGLWEIESHVKMNGQDPAATAKKSMANLPAAQRKQMEAMMAKNGASMEKQSMKVCYTEAMTQNPEKLMPKEKQSDAAGCTSKTTTHTAEKVVINFECKNGSKGTSEWESKSSSFESKSTFTDASGKKFESSSIGKFISADCGSVKPVGTM